MRRGFWAVAAGSLLLAGCGDGQGNARAYAGRSALPAGATVVRPSAAYVVSDPAGGPRTVTRSVRLDAASDGGGIARVRTTVLVFADPIPARCVDQAQLVVDAVRLTGKRDSVLAATAAAVDPSAGDPAAAVPAPDPAAPASASPLWGAVGSDGAIRVDVAPLYRRGAFGASVGLSIAAESTGDELATGYVAYSAPLSAVHLDVTSRPGCR